MMKKQYLIMVVMVFLFLVLFSSCKKEQEMAWESNYVVANDIKFHYTRTGYNKPLIVAVHGITDNGLCWSKVANRLNDRYDFLMLDARGHGLSDAPTWGYNLDTYMEDLAGVIEKLDIKNPILLGHSLGAVTVAMLASSYPRIARAIILEDPVGLEHRDSKTDSNVIKERRSEIVERKQMTQEQLVQLCSTQVHPNWPDSRDMIPWAQAKLQVSPEVAALFGQIGGLADYFSDIKCPVLILKADAEPEQRASQQELFKKITDYRLIYVPGAGHNIRREQFEVYIQHIEQFLSKI
jgi:pimeloyl-ACP methyl ester carboxylesterase